MMYHQKLVACVKVDGKVLRESGDSVSIPFGSEYSILLKNLNSVRVMVKVSIDGKDTTEGTWLVIPPNGSIDLERYIRNGNFDSGNRFKFIAMTKGIEQHRGVQAEDGLIRIEWKTEKVTQQVDHIHHRHHYYDHYYDYYNWPWGYPGPRRPYILYGDVYKCDGVFNSGEGVVSSTGISGTTVNMNNVTLTNTSGSLGQPGSSVMCNFTRTMNSSAPSPLRGRLTKSSSRPDLRPRASSGIRGQSLGVTARKGRSLEYGPDSIKQQSVDDAGITVPGSESNQKFKSTGWFPTHDQSEVLVLKLRGEVAGKKVKKAVTVKTKLTCPTCGKKNKGTAAYCSECGTALDLI